ncbi:MAG: F0F1 ATP synthase subunit epsilon, partial [Tepidisphaeraceae bacterium]
EYPMAFACVVVTPEQQVLSESLTQAIIPAADGLLGILTNRAPVLAKLAKGPLRLDLASGQTKLFQIDGGIAQMLDNELTILTQSAAERAKA